MRDQDIDALSPVYGKLIDSFTEALCQGKEARRKWLDTHFGQTYPDTIPNSDIIFDLRNNVVFDYIGKMYLCQGCGGLLVEYRKEEYKYFTSSDASVLNFEGLTKKKE